MEKHLASRSHRNCENNVKIRTKMNNPGDWPQKPWEATRASAPWMSMVLAHGQQPVACVPESGSLESSQALLLCCKTCVHRTYQARCSRFSSSVSLLSVSTEKESIFWLPRCARCFLHKEHLTCFHADILYTEVLEQDFSLKGNIRWMFTRKVEH